MKLITTYIGLLLFWSAPFALSDVSKRNGVLLSTVKYNGQTVAGGGTTYDQVIGSTSDSTPALGNSATLNTWRAMSFTADDDYTVTGVTLHCNTVGSPTTQTMDVELWTNSGSSPGSLVSGMTVQVNMSSLPSTAAGHEFTFGSTAAVTNGTTYWIVPHADQNDASNYIQLAFLSTGTEAVKRSTDTTSWTDTDITATPRMTIHGTQ